MSKKTVSFPIVGGSNFQRSGAFDNQRSINCYPFVDDVMSQNALYRYTGSKKLLDFDVGGADFTGRPGGAISNGEFAFFVVGDRVYRVGTALSPALIGTLPTNMGQVSMAVVGQYVVIVDGSSKFAYDTIGGTFDPLPITAPPNPTYVEEQEGFTFLNNVNTQTLAQSAANDPFKFNALSNIQINYKSSPAFPLLAMKSVNGSLLCFTKGFIETLDPVQKAGFTFRPDLNLTYEYGTLNSTCVAPGTGGTSGQKDEKFVIFICMNDDGTLKVMKTDGSSPRIISTPSVEFRLNQLTAPEEAVGFVWSENGQTFYQVSWTTDNLTLVYNVNNGAWFDAQYRQSRHFAEAFTSFDRKKLVTSYLDNGLYELSESYVDNDGEPITVERITANMRGPNYNQMTGHMLRLWFQQGVGLSGTINPDDSRFVYGSEPEITLYISHDGGVTFPEVRHAKLGRTGEREYVTEFENLGSDREWTFKIGYQMPTDFFLFDAQFTYTLSGGTQ